MNIYELQMDLFEFKKNPKYYFAHCIGADALMGAGIAIRFYKEFHEVRDLRNQIFKKQKVLKVGTCERTGKVFNLITKPKSARSKPSYDDLEQSLIECKNQCWDRNVEYLAMPKIGCGLDGLDWNLVKAKIIKVFGEIGGLDIKVCYL